MWGFYTHLSVYLMLCTCVFTVPFRQLQSSKFSTYPKYQRTFISMYISWQRMNLVFNVYEYVPQRIMNVNECKMISFRISTYTLLQRKSICQRMLHHLQRIFISTYVTLQVSLIGYHSFQRIMNNKIIKVYLFQRKLINLH